MLWMFLLPLAFGREVVLRNDLVLDDSYDDSDELVWLEYPACAVAVLEPDPDDLPIRIDTVLVYLGSSLGNQDRQNTMLTMAMAVLDDDEAPALVGYNDWDWPETAFYVTVSSENYNALSLDDTASGIYPFTLERGRLAVFVCAPDPTWDGQYAWPCETEGEDCSGLVVETGSPSEGSWIVAPGPAAEPISALGVEGAWVIRAVGETERTLDSGDSGGAETGETGVEDETGEPVVDDENEEGCHCGTAAAGGAWLSMLMPLWWRRRRGAGVR